MGFTAGSGRPTPIEPPKPTPPMSGGKGAGRVSPIVESRPMFRPAQQAGTPDFNNIVETSTAVNQGTQQIPPSTGGGGKGSARVAPVTPQPMPMTPPPVHMTPPPVPPGLDNPVFRSLGQQQSAQQPQQSITGMNTNTGSTNSMPAPQSAIFKQGGLIGLMRRR